jgi:chromosome segregation ATPase
MVEGASEAEKMEDDRKSREELRQIRDLLLEADKRSRLSAHLIESLHATVRDMATEQLEQRKQITAHREDFAEHRVEDAEHMAQVSGDLRRLEGEVKRTDGDIKRLSYRVGVLEKREEKLEKDVEDTGRFRLDELNRQIDEHKENATWWRRHHITVIVGAMTTVFGALFAILVAWAAKLLHLK